MWGFFCFCFFKVRGESDVHCVRVGGKMPLWSVFGPDCVGEEGRCALTWERGRPGEVIFANISIKSTKGINSKGSQWFFLKNADAFSCQVFFFISIYPYFDINFVSIYAVIFPILDSASLTQIKSSDSVIKFTSCV